MDIESKGYERYFDRPEVTAAYKKQQLIETPEFSQLFEDATVGSRFRPRATFEEVRLPILTLSSRMLMKFFPDAERS